MKLNLLLRCIIVSLVVFTSDMMDAQNVDPTRPNIVLILADDMGYGDVGYLGATDVRTPNIDALAGEGIVFTQAYVSASVCGPSRAGLLTGVYQQRFGSSLNEPEKTWYEGTDMDNGLSLEQPMVSELLESYNYTSKAIGKWHMGLDEAYRPNQRGYDEFYGFLNGAHDYYEADMDFGATFNKWPIFRDNTPEAFSGYATDVFSDEAVTFIQNNAANPFFVYLSYNAVHSPWQVPQEYIDRVSHIEEEERKLFAGMVLAVDDGVGRVVQELKDQGVYDNTLFFFISDNGSPSSEAGRMSRTGGYRGWKGDPYEGGIRVPYIINWPNKLTGGTSYNKPVSTLDVVPTILNHLGQSSNNARFDFDGKDLVPYLDGTIGAEESVHEALYFRRQNDYAIRKGDWKLVNNDGDANKPMLFDMVNDEFETTDLYDQYPEIAKGLQNDFDNWDRNLTDNKWWGGPGNRDYQYKMIEHFDGTFEDYEFVGTEADVTCTEVANPLAAGINTSANVLQIHSASTNTASTATAKAKINKFTNHPHFAHVKFYSNALTTVSFQIISGSNTYTYPATNAFSKTNEWEDIVFDCSSFAGSIDSVAVQVEYSAALGDYDIYVDDIQFTIDPNPIAASAVFTETTPFGLKSSDIEDTQFTLSWYGLEGATTYHIIMNGSELKTATDTFSVIDGLDSKSINQFSIIGENASAEMSLESNTLEVAMPNAPLVFDDFESGGTMFGDFAGATTSVVTNPLKSGINTSDNVLQIDLPGDASRQDWAGTVAADFSSISTGYRYLHIKMLKTVVSPIFAKSSGSGSGTGSDIESLNPQALTNEWEDMVFDMADSEKVITALNIQVDRTSARVAHTVYIDDIFMNNNPNSLNATLFTELKPYGLKLTEQTDTELSLEWSEMEDATSYVVYVNDVEYTTTTSTNVTVNVNSDEKYSIYIVAKNASDESSLNSQEVTVYMPNYNYIMEDFEDATTVFKNFAGSTATVVDNPLMEGINTSSKVMKVDLPATGRKDWAGIVGSGGATSLPAFTGNLRYIHVKLLKTVISPVQCKPNGSGSGVGSDLVPMQAQALTGEWEDLVFDITDGDKTITALNIQVDRTSTYAAHTVYVDDIIINNNPDPIVDLPTSIDTNLSGKSVEKKLYPNPAGDYFYVADVETIDDEVEIFNLSGVKVLGSLINNGNGYVNISSLPAGTYIVRFRSNNVICTKKLIKSNN